MPAFAQAISTEVKPAASIALNTAQIVSHPQGPIDRQELEAFLDNFFTQQMADLHIPGAVFALVKDGKPFFAKGYGYANLEKQIPASPDKTLFRLASVSKLFATTAVMQLVEQGQINLHEDINHYLTRFQVAETYAAPVTLDNLLTHTGGFDERFIGIAARNTASIAPLADYLAQRMPPRVMPPGSIISYSNHGIALVGYLVETIAGLPFAQYVDEYILQPLRMRHSSFLQPLPSYLAPDLAVGYAYKHGRYQPLPPYFVNDAPAGALKATATDISHFMIAHLQNGQYDQTQVLQAKTIQEIHRQHFTHHPRLPGWAYGFSERFQNGQRAIEHGGTDPGFASLLFLLPEQNLGFFVAYNNHQDELREQLVKQFLDRYYPVSIAAPSAQLSKNQRRMNYFIGSYRYNRYSHKTLEKIAPVLFKAPTSAPEIHIKATSDGILILEPHSFRRDRSPRRAIGQVDSVLSTQAGAQPNVNSGVPFSATQPNQLVEVDSLLFQWLGGPLVAFREDNQGHITHLFIGADAFEKLAWYETTAFQTQLLGGCILIFLLTCIRQGSKFLSFWLSYSATHSSCFRMKDHLTIHHFGSILPTVISTLNLSFLGGLFLLLLFSNLYEFAYGITLGILGLLYIPALSIGCTSTAIILILITWNRPYWSGLRRWYYLTIVFTSYSFLWSLSYWNLLGFQF
ncbi:MAG: beta-lactamase family protein [Scytolyngbya sp. HA4215-MV1]|nr:beta-lactamase family protein [Scytolyngbya sp. HA4215-MV1]